MEREAVVVLGMHRSGTSTTAGMFAQLGYKVGKSIMEGNETNPKGFFENFRLMFFNEALLHHNKVNWHNTVTLPENWWKAQTLAPLKAQLKTLISEEFGDERKLLFKDPRLCILLPFYLDVFKEMDIVPRFLITMRNVSDIVLSLERRDHFPKIKSTRIWMDHMLKSLFHTRGFPRSIIQYQDVISDPLKCMDQAMVDMGLMETITTEQKKEILAFIEPNLNHGRKIYTQEDDNLPEEVTMLERIINKIQDKITDCQADLDLEILYKDFYAEYNNKANPLISVITIVLDDNQILDETLFSVVGQVYPRVEYILVVNENCKRARAFLDFYFYLVTNIVTANVETYSEALNLGIHNASGDMISIIEPGDCYHSERSLKTIIEEAGRGDLLILSNDSRLKMIHEFLHKNWFFKQTVFDPEISLSYGLFPQNIIADSVLLKNERSRSVFAWIISIFGKHPNVVLVNEKVVDQMNRSDTKCDYCDFLIWCIQCTRTSVRLTGFSHFFLNIKLIILRIIISVRKIKHIQSFKIPDK